MVTIVSFTVSDRNRDQRGDCARQISINKLRVINTVISRTNGTNSWVKNCFIGMF